jgi:TRAP-type C4-dicarboxylate transport system permease small subunit
MQKMINAFFKLLEFLVVACLVAMVIMVFGNVVLRYGFNSGISISDEMSRYCFIWLTYIGAMVAMREKGHLGVDTLVRRLPLGQAVHSVVLHDVSHAHAAPHGIGELTQADGSRIAVTGYAQIQQVAVGQIGASQH